MDIGIAEVHKSEKKHLGEGGESSIEGAELSIGGGGTPKLFKLTPVTGTPRPPPRLGRVK